MRIDAQHDNVWCTTCQHHHIPQIPVVTHCCADCGWGQWSVEVAEVHATEHPDHLVYAIHHQTVADPSFEVLPRALVDATHQVVQYVSRGRGFVGVEPYPDATARRLNAALSEYREKP